jgi:hypothetical protein
MFFTWSFHFSLGLPVGNHLFSVLIWFKHNPFSLYTQKPVFPFLFQFCFDPFKKVPWTQVKSQDSSISMAMGHGLDAQGFNSRQMYKISFYSTASRLALGPTHPPIQ